MDNYCRFCLKNLSQTDTIIEINRTITERFKTLTGLEIEESLAYSTVICTNCDRKIDDFTKFKKELIKKQTELQFRGNLLDEDSDCSSIPDELLIRPISSKTDNLIKPVQFNSADTKQKDRPNLNKNTNHFPHPIKLEPAQEPEFFNIDSDPFFSTKSLLFQSFLDESRTQTFIKPKREIQCSFCDRAFPDNFKLKRHEKSHLGIKDYKCSLCEKRYYRQEALNRHYRTVHLNLRFHCSVDGCINQYARKETYRHHVISQHSDLGPEKVNQLLLHIKNIPVPKVENNITARATDKPRIPPFKIKLPFKLPKPLIEYPIKETITSSPKAAIETN